MNVNRLYWVVILGLAALAVGLARGIADPQPTGAPGTVAVCDLIRTFREYKRTADLYTKMESQQQAIRADQEQREKQFQQMQQDIEALRAGSQAYLDQMEAIEAYAIESRVAVETAQARLKRQHRQATHEMMSIIQQTIAAVAAEQGYTVVLNRGRLDLNEEPAQQLASPHVLYATDAVDITGVIVARLNEQYDAQQAQ